MNTLDSIRSYRQFKPLGAIYHSIGLFDNNGNCCGGCYYWDFFDIQVSIVEFIFVAQDHRGQGLSDALLKHVAFPMVIEVDDGGSAEPYWKRHGFRKIDYDYVQPPIVEENEEFSGLNLWTNSPNEIDVDDVLKNHYWKYAFV